MTNRALLVVDMQNGFCHPEGSFSRIGMGLEGTQDAVRNAAVAVAQARRAAIPVVFTRHLYRPGRADEGGALIRNSPALAGIDGLAAGSWDADVMDELATGRAALDDEFSSNLAAIEADRQDAESKLAAERQKVNAKLTDRQTEARSCIRTAEDLAAQISVLGKLTFARFAWSAVRGREM